MVFVFPTPVGVFPRYRLCMFSISGLPHARGGVSGTACLSLFPDPSSPRPWGCFYYRSEERARQMVFPTPVGVFPMNASTSG